MRQKQASRGRNIEHWFHIVKSQAIENEFCEVATYYKVRFGRLGANS
jgi:hypothetical protein